MAEKRISLQKLAHLIPDLTPEKIARLPLERLPISLPEQWCRQFPEDKAEVLLQLSRRLADPNQRRQAEARLYEQLHAAAGWIQRPDAIADWLETVNENLRSAERLLQRWREANGALRGGSGAWSSSTSLHSEIELATGNSVGIRDVEHVCSTLALSFSSREQAVLKYGRVLASLEKAIERKYPVAGLEDAVKQARSQLERLSNYMSRFRLLRLNLVSEEMADVKREIEGMSRRRLELASNLETVRHELKMAESWSKRLSGGRRKSNPEDLRRTLSRLETEQDHLTVPIEDDRIYNWLNVLADAIIDEYCQNMAKTQVDRARTLFVALLKYRRRYSSGPDLNARDALSRSRRDDATRELQRLIAEVFGQQQPDPILAIRAPQQFHESMEQLKNQMLSELLAPTAQRYAIGN